MIVWCRTCKDDTLINTRGICSWCNTKLDKRDIQKAKKETR